jgi:hypothetical protein
MTKTLITGANQGLNLHAARRLLALGHDVWVTARDPKAGIEATGEIDAHFVRLDVTYDISASTAAQVVAEVGGIDVVINNAGIADRTPVVETIAFTPSGVGAIAKTARASELPRSVPKASRAPGKYSRNDERRALSSRWAVRGAVPFPACPLSPFTWSWRGFSARGLAVFRHVLEFVLDAETRTATTRKSDAWNRSRPTRVTTPLCRDSDVAGVPRGTA